MCCTLVSVMVGVVSVSSVLGSSRLSEIFMYVVL